MLEDCQTLEELWKIIDDINKKHFPENNLKPILGGGLAFCPKFMFIFINPTSANISSKQNWPGPRFPFVGTKAIWRIFHQAGLLDEQLIEKINSSKLWSVGFTNDILNFLKTKSFYFTNIVKWTGANAALPDSQKIKLFLPILEKEIEIVKPRCIVTFGLIPFENLTKQKIKLSDYYSRVKQKQQLESFDIKCGQFKTKLIPCYFPIGRGNPKRAVEMLKLIQHYKP